jgi:hypothetical protein
MVRQGLKQDARRRVTEALSAQRKERVERERRQVGLAIQVLTALAERDEAIQAAEQQAAHAVRQLVAEHLDIAEIAELCGSQIDAKELTRLSRISSEVAAAAASGVKS